MVRAALPDERRKQCLLLNSCFISCSKCLHGALGCRQAGSARMISSRGIGEAAGGRVRPIRIKVTG